MLPAYRSQFSRQFSDLSHKAFLADLGRRVRGPVGNVAETPCFFPGALVTSLADAAVTMTRSLVDDPVYLDAANHAVPARFRVANQEPRPTFVHADFGLVRDRKIIEGRLLELRAFPSLHGFQLALADAYAREYDLAAGGKLTPFLGGLDRAGYVELVRRALTGTHDPVNVVQLEIEPSNVPVHPDVGVTESTWGVRAVDINEVIVDRRRLFYRRAGSLTRIARIYNRVSPDELDEKGLSLPFDVGDDLDVEWAGAPDWFFRIGPFSLPHLRHPLVPITRLLGDAIDTGSQLGAAFADRERWVLKPLAARSGNGVIAAPTDDQIAAVPEGERGQFILQERIDFTPVIETPHGLVEAEIRILLVRDGDTYTPAIPLVRLGGTEASAAFMTQK